jgi:hypothetical protein
MRGSEGEVSFRRSVGIGAQLEADALLAWEHLANPTSGLLVTTFRTISTQPHTVDGLLRCGNIPSFSTGFDRSVVGLTNFHFIRDFLLRKSFG